MTTHATLAGLGVGASGVHWQACMYTYFEATIEGRRSSDLCALLRGLGERP